MVGHSDVYKSIYISTPPMLFQPKKLHKATKKGYQGKPFAVSNPSQTSSTTVKTFTNSTHMRIPMLHTHSAAGMVSLLVDESSVTAQTEMHTNKAPKHVPRLDCLDSCGGTLGRV